MYFFPEYKVVIRGVRFVLYGGVQVAKHQYTVCTPVQSTNNPGWVAGSELIFIASEKMVTGNNHAKRVEYKRRSICLIPMFVFPGNRGFGDYREV